MVLRPEGLQLRLSKNFGKAAGQKKTVPYGEIQSTTIDKDMFNLYAKAESKPLLSISVGTLNFYPGFFAVLALKKLAQSQNIPNSSRAFFGHHLGRPGRG